MLVHLLDVDGIPISFNPDHVVLVRPADGLCRSQTRTVVVTLHEAIVVQGEYAHIVGLIQRDFTNGGPHT